MNIDFFLQVEEDFVEDGTKIEFKCKDGFAKHVHKDIFCQVSQLIYCYFHYKQEIYAVSLTVPYRAS